MKTIYLLQKTGRYAVAPKILRAYESRIDADEAKMFLELVEVEGLEIVPLDLQTGQPYEPLPLQPRNPPPMVSIGVPPGYFQGGPPAVAGAKGFDGVAS